MKKKDEAKKEPEVKEEAFTDFCEWQGCEDLVKADQRFCDKHKMLAASRMLNMGLMMGQKPSNVAGGGIAGHGSARGQRGQERQSG